MSAQAPKSLDSFNCRKTLTVNGKTFTYYSLPDAEKNGLAGISKLPFSLKILVENLLRNEDGRTVKKEDIAAAAKWLEDKGSAGAEIGFRPARVLMQDFTGVPAVVDLAAMRDGVKALGGDPKSINPLVPVDLVIDHSVIVDEFGSPSAFAHNVELEYERNGERYNFLKWGQGAFDNFRVVPPGTGICHQVNLEYLAQTVWTNKDADGNEVAYPDTLVGTDSHTTMVNGLAVLGWGVGGIEAEAAMLGQAISMLLPEVIGFKLTGKLPEGVTATDLVLTVTQMLRKRGVVSKFVEFYGPGLDNMTLADRATIANMAPEYGATCGFFPVDGETLNYLTMSGRENDRIELVEAYAKAQGLYREAGSADPVFTDTLELDLGDVVPSMAGPKRPEGRIPLTGIATGFASSMETEFKKPGELDKRAPVEGEDFDFGHGDVAIAAITSCTNTSNPSVLIAAGLVARKAVEKGLKVQPFVKTSLAPGSRVVSSYLEKLGLDKDLEQLGFYNVGYGCTTCIGNSGPLPEPVRAAIYEGDLVAASVLSGNRNFEGRVSPHVKANYLAGPPLVVAYALAGTVNIDLSQEALGKGVNGEDVFLKDIWPSQAEVNEAMGKALSPEMFRSQYGNTYTANETWNAIKGAESALYSWDETSTYVQEPPFFEDLTLETQPIKPINDMRCLVKVGDSVTTDHISPAGSFTKDTPAGKYLQDNGVEVKDFNSYGSRRGNDRVMTRGTFANIRLRNQLAPGTEGGFTKNFNTGEITSIYDASLDYKAKGTPLFVLAGKEYGTGSSRDWAAKGTLLLGVKAVLAESFERIHRSNLVFMGVLPLQFKEGENAETYGLTGEETFSLPDLNDQMTASQDVTVTAKGPNGEKTFTVMSRVDTPVEVEYYRNGGILHTVLRQLAAK